jgi:cholesterol transport system auxiliary component
MVPLSRTIALLPAALALLLGACASAPPAERDRFFRLEAPVAAIPAGAPVSATLVVNDLRAGGFEGGQRIVYRTPEAPLQTHRYPTLWWEEPPGRALAGLLAEGLRAAGLVGFVVRPDQRVRGDYLLGGELARFEHRPTDQPPRVVGDFTLTLVRASDRSPLLSRRYQGEEPVRESTPEAMAAAFNRLAGRLVGEAVADLAALRPRLRGPT